MNTAGPLAGKTIVVTRPRAQATELAAGIEALGGHALIFPLLEISPPADPHPLQQAIARLADYHLAVFISPNAVDHALVPILAAGQWPAHVQPAAIGPGTVKALARFGIQHCLCPTSRFDSEGLLAEPELAPEQIAGQRVLIFRGNGGRELLADTLRQRGAQVDCVTAYQRHGPSQPISTLRQHWRDRQLHALTLSSSEALRYLIEALDAEGRDFLAATPLFIPHPRIAEQAHALGLTQIIQTEAADAGILSALGAYNWPA